MPRHSSIQKKVQNTVQSAPRRPRKKREVKQLPAPFKVGIAVKITDPDTFKGIRLGLVEGICKFDGGILVHLTNPQREGIAEKACIQTSRGHTIEIIQK